MHKKVIGKCAGIVLALVSLACAATPLTVREVATATPLASVTVSAVVLASPVKFVQPTAIMSATPWVLTAVGDVNVRAAPWADSAVLATLRKGESVTVRVLADGWYWTARGYIKAEWLK